MKCNDVFLLITAITFLFLMACENSFQEKPVVSTYQEITKPNDDQLAPLFICANRWYADRLFAPNDVFSWEPCGGDELTITGTECAYLWAAFNPYYDEDLLDKACGESIPPGLPAISGFNKIPANYPKMKWNFMWAHFYVIQRKINDGDWQTIYIYTVPLEPMEPEIPDTTYTDYSIYLRTFVGRVYYKIFGKVWEEMSESAPIIYWDTLPQIESIDQ